MPARELAASLVDAVLVERPTGADGRAAVIVNGLGSTKYEELFVLYSHIERLLSGAGVEPILPEVGEIVTSLDMAGCSLSVMWLDDELSEYWQAPADTAAFRRGAVSTLPAFEGRRPSHTETAAAEEVVAEASEASLAAADVARRVIAAMARVVADNEEMLAQIDAVAGDGDHGVGMARGARAAQAAADETSGGVGEVLAAAGDAFGDRAGGTSGVLWGVSLAAVGNALGNRDEVTPQRLHDAVRHGAQTMQRVGKAERGDKTMLDALLPFVDTLSSELDDGHSLADAWRAAAATAVAAGAATASIQARIGRARPLAERSIGTPDPGAVSMGLILTAVGDVLAEAQCAQGVGSQPKEIAR
jgi:dihydroxyacetone kinase